MTEEPPQTTGPAKTPAPKKSNTTAIVAVVIIAILAILVIGIGIAASGTNNEKTSLEDKTTITLTVHSNNLLRSSYDIYFNGMKTETVQIEQNGNYTTSKTYTWQKNEADGKSYVVKVHQYNSFGQEDDQKTITIYKGQTYYISLTA